jgi:uncharacterized protein (DUF924 family)
MRNAWADDVLRFWFHDLKPRAWFRTDPKLDEEIRQDVRDRAQRAAAGAGLAACRSCPQSNGTSTS